MVAAPVLLWYNGRNTAFRGCFTLKKNVEKTEIFERMPVPKALAVMAIPTIVSQLIALVYNIADTWFIAKTDNPYMVAASSLVLTVYLLVSAVADLFAVGGGNLAVRLLGAKEEEEAEKVASWSLTMTAITAVVFSSLCLIFMNPLLRLLGASDQTIGYAREYLLFVVVIGGLPTMLGRTMSSMLRNIGYSREAGFGLTLGGVLNVVLDPLFMFVIMPDGYQVMGAAIATMLSNVVSLVYFTMVYRRVSPGTILKLPRKLEKIQKQSVRSLFSVGIPAAVSFMLYDLTNMVINRLSAFHGDLELAAMGIVLKVERLPQNVCIGICLGMMPLVAYNYAAGNRERMRKFFTAARVAGIFVSLASLVMYRLWASQIIHAFIKDSMTVAYGTEFLRIRAFAALFMFLSFNMVHFMQAVDRGRVSLWLAVIRQLCLNIPLLLVMNRMFGMTGIVWTQTLADVINVAVSYVIYHQVKRRTQL